MSGQKRAARLVLDRHRSGRAGVLIHAGRLPGLNFRSELRPLDHGPVLDIRK